MSSRLNLVNYMRERFLDGSSDSKKGSASSHPVSKEGCSKRTGPVDSSSDRNDGDNQYKPPLWKRRKIPQPGLIRKPSQGSAKGSPIPPETNQRRYSNHQNTSKICGVKRKPPLVIPPSETRIALRKTRGSSFQIRVEGKPSPTASYRGTNEVQYKHGRNNNFIDERGGLEVSLLLPSNTHPSIVTISTPPKLWHIPPSHYIGLLFLLKINPKSLLSKAYIGTCLSSPNVTQSSITPVLFSPSIQRNTTTLFNEPTPSSIKVQSLPQTITSLGNLPPKSPTKAKPNF